MIRPAGFMTNKSKALQTIGRWYLEHGENASAVVGQYGDRLRRTLLSLHGVGPETADVLLTYIFDQPQFIADNMHEHFLHS